MKRIHLWIRELSLTQQLLSIAFLAIAGFIVFLSVFLTPSVDAFTEEEMYRVIHTAQDYYISYHQITDSENSFRKEGDVIHVLYDADKNQFSVSEDSALYEDLKEQIRSDILAATPEKDYIYTRNNGLFSRADKILYSVIPLKDNHYLITLLPASYENAFRGSLMINVVNTNLLVVAILFVVLILWVISLIRPLYQIRSYIMKIKNDEPAVLNIQRRDEIGEVADALTEMEAELSKQKQEKQEMIQNISHDLKTPIATIRSYGESIKDGVYPYGTLDKSIDVIIEHADRLDKKVRSLIALNKMDYLLDDLPEGNNLNMNQIIEKVLLSLSVIRPEIAFERDMEENVMFHGDEDPWRIVVENLIDNALRYAKTTIQIVLRENELKIINDGKQISEDRMNTLFRPYEKGTDGKFGLGLAIVYKVTTTYGYRVAAENLKDGVCFRIWKETSKKDKQRKNSKK